ncbi:hypothetical protein DFH06DRAFT_1138386 [Mycena polygramma]|nr:hypothetical protein DFH06DRAFT_1138386 [Mycena polygramma]
MVLVMGMGEGVLGGHSFHRQKKEKARLEEQIHGFGRRIPTRMELRRRLDGPFIGQREAEAVESNPLPEDAQVAAGGDSVDDPCCGVAREQPDKPPDVRADTRAGRYSELRKAKERAMQDDLALCSHSEIWEQELPSPRRKKEGPKAKVGLCQSSDVPIATSLHNEQICMRSNGDSEREGRLLEAGRKRKTFERTSTGKRDPTAGVTVQEPHVGQGEEEPVHVFSGAIHESDSKSKPVSATVPVELGVRRDATRTHRIHDSAEGVDVGQTENLGVLAFVIQHLEMEGDWKDAGQARQGEESAPRRPERLLLRRSGNRQAKTHQLSNSFMMVNDSEKEIICTQPQPQAWSGRVPRDPLPGAGEREGAIGYLGFAFASEQLDHQHDLLAFDAAATATLDYEYGLRLFLESVRERNAMHSWWDLWEREPHQKTRPPSCLKGRARRAELDRSMSLQAKQRGKMSKKSVVLIRCGLEARFRDQTHRIPGKANTIAASGCGHLLEPQRGRRASDAPPMSLGRCVDSLDSRPSLTEPQRQRRAGPLCIRTAWDWGAWARDERTDEEDDTRRTLSAESESGIPLHTRPNTLLGLASMPKHAQRPFLAA